MPSVVDSFRRAWPRNGVIQTDIISVGLFVRVFLVHSQGGPLEVRTYSRPPCTDTSTPLAKVDRLTDPREVAAP